jgi:indole-3-glycerol phosphate synthase
MMATQTILDEMVRWKREEVSRARKAVPHATMRARAASAPSPRDLEAALRDAGNPATVRLIAEVKHASPSRGLLRPDFDPVALAREYQAHGASAISVLTDDRFFQGAFQHLQAVRQSVGLPLLSKDIFLDPYQLHQARAAGADAILLIVAALSDGDLAALYQDARSLGMAALVEVHNEDELTRALQLGPRILGINNRDLRTFRVDLETTLRLRPLVPADIILVSESGIRTRADVERLSAAGVDAMLVGESLVRARDVGQQVRELVG